MRLDEIPLPRGPKAMVEGVLLGRALLGQDPADVDQVILLHEAWEAAGLPADGVTVHVTRRRAGQTVQDDYITADLAGGGRRHGGTRISAPSGEIHELLLEDGAPARDRFRRIHGYLIEELGAAQAVHAGGGRHPDPVALRRWAFIDAVARTLTLGPADAAHPTLTAISQDAWPRLSAATAPPALAEIARGLEERALASRERGELSALPAAALLLAARLPTAVAATAPAGRQTVELARHLGFAILELGVSAWQAIYGPPHKALREGYRAAVLAAAGDLLAAAERHRDLALDGPADREHFSEQLLLALPYALAAMQLDRFLLAAAGADPTVRHHASTAEETFVRLQEGLVHQWLDGDDAQLRADRDRIRDAQRRGDALAVQLLLREGELALFRPRAVRGLLLGDVPWPSRTEAPER